ncbi:D-glycero-beta-D-manno-heptose-7-phosphate kinase [Patescibacteria group bacterium]
MNSAKANRIIAKFPNQNILIIGDVMLDSAVWGKVERISPEAPVPVVHVQKETYVPGGAANVANNIKALDGQVTLIGLVGNDNNRKILEKQFRQHQIDTKYLLIDRQRPTIRKTRIMGIPQHQLLRIDEEVTDTVSPAMARQLVAQVKKAIKRAKALVISDYAKGVISLEVARAAIAAAHEQSIPVIIDPKPEHKDFYSQATVVTPNQKEVLKMAGNGEDDLKAGINLARELDANIVLTRSEAGMAIIQKGQRPKLIKTKAKEVFDVSGAGDTVVAGLALALAGGSDLVSAADIANHAAGVVVGKVGTSTLTRGELRKVLKNSR